jgi:hypothetical protein
MDGGGGGLSRVFRPEHFFLGRTRGLGVVSSFGRELRCRVTTDGMLDSNYNSLHFDERFEFSDGRVDEWRWAMTRGSDGRYVAAEAMAGAGIVGHHDRGDYVLAFRRPLRPEGGFPTPGYRTRFTLLNTRTALKRVRVSVLGLPVAAMTVYHQRDD